MLERALWKLDFQGKQEDRWCGCGGPELEGMLKTEWRGEGN